MWPWQITKISLHFSSNIHVLYYFVFVSINKNVLIDLVNDNNPELILFAVYLTNGKHENDDEITSCFRWAASKIMESMLNKLKSTVTKVTADMTSTIMGNPVTREFEVGRHIASGGPGMSWRIYNGTKKSTKQVRQLFIIITLTLSCI